MKTKVVAKCISKKETQNYDDQFPIRTTIEFEVPYDQSSVYWKMSGGTNLELNMVNQETADMFVIGKHYEILVQWVEEDKAGSGESLPDAVPKPLHKEPDTSDEDDSDWDSWE